VDAKQTAKLIEDIVGPTVGDVVKMLRAEIKAEIKQSRDRESLERCERIAELLEPCIASYLALRTKQWDARLKALENLERQPQTREVARPRWADK
jgi:hypothetical protein